MTTPSDGPERDAGARLGWGPLLAVSAALGAIAALLAGRAALDPPVPDASEVVTDTDGTTWFPPDDAGVEGLGQDAGGAADQSSGENE